MRLNYAPIVLALVVGCSVTATDGGTPMGSANSAGDEAGHRTTGQPATTEASDGGSGSGSSGIPPNVLDVAHDDAPVPPAEGCAKIDFLFVIDDSGSMTDEQMQLLASFAGFMTAIQDTVTAGDYRVMVTDTKGPTCDCDQVTCADEDDLIAECVDLCYQFCGGIGCEVVPGVARTWDNTGADCSFMGGNFFITHEEPDLEAAFTCAANMGVDGSPSENTAHAILAATSGSGGAAECNGGQFLRDDAILVVTFITDEEDHLSGGDPPQWHDDLVALKAGDEDSIVVLGLLGDTEFPGGLCTWDGVFGAQDAPRLREFVDSFGASGMWASVCEPDYAVFFEQAVGLIDTACVNFPAG